MFLRVDDAGIPVSSMCATTLWKAAKSKCNHEELGLPRYDASPTISAHKATRTAIVSSSREATAQKATDRGVQHTATAALLQTRFPELELPCCSASSTGDAAAHRAVTSRHLALSATRLDPAEAAASSPTRALLSIMAHN